MGKEQRPAIISLFERKFTPVEISRLLAVPIRTVRDAIKRYKELGNLKDRPKIGRPVTVCNQRNRNIIKKRIDRNPMRSMRAMARSLDISDGSVRKMVKDQLGYHPYKIGKGHYLNDAMKANRLIKARKMKRLAAAGRHRSVLFTDEKIFTVEQAHNHQNDRQLLPQGPPSTRNAKLITRSHFPASVMVWAGICGSGKTPLVFVEKGVKINAKVYQESILKAVVDPWARSHFKDQPWTFQQDWAPAHSAKSTLELCRELFPNIWDKGVWPSNSPDLNPLDYAIWSILEKKVCSTRYDSVQALKKALLKGWEEITESDLAAIVDNFIKRLDLCIGAQGGHFENLMQ